MKKKRCTTCKEEKAVAEFGRNRQAPDGLHYYCKTCAALRQRTWASNNPKKLKTIKDKYLNRVRALNDARDPYVMA